MVMIERVLSPAEISNLIDGARHESERAPLAELGLTLMNGCLTPFGSFVRRVEFDRLLDDAFGPLNATQTAQNDLLVGQDA